MHSVSKEGGVSSSVTINADASLSWKIDAINATYGGSRGATVNHLIEVVNGEGTVIGSVNGADATIVPGAYSVSETFGVKFPKIYYPNREISISVEVKVSIVGSPNLTRSMTFTQTALTSPGLYPYAPQTAGYGNIHGGSVNTRYVRTLKQHESARPTTSLTVNSNYLHMNYYGLAATYDWATVKNFRSQRDGLTFVTNDLDYNPALSMLNNSSSVLNGAGYVIGPVEGISVGHYGRVNTTTAVAATKIYKMVVNGQGGGTTDISGTLNTSGTLMWTDNVSSYASTYPASAVPLLMTNQNHVLLTVDPKNNIIYQGENQIFDTDNGNQLLANFIIYVKNASKWGSAFTDLMIDDEHEGSQPAPWDPYWGKNAGIARN